MSADLIRTVTEARLQGLSGRYPRSVFPDTIAQTCVVHLLSHSTDFASWKDQKAVAASLNDIHRTTDTTAAEEASLVLEASVWGQRYRAIGQSWRCAWSKVMPFLAFPPEVRRIIYASECYRGLELVAALRLPRSR